MKRTVSLLLVALMLLGTLSACGGEKTVTVQIGDTAYSMTLPEGYQQGDMQMDEDQIAYYYKDENSLDFDVYVWDKEGYVLEEEAKYFAEMYDAEVEKFTAEGAEGYRYISEEEFAGFVWTVYNYMFEDANNIIELCFWTDNSTDEIAVVEGIIASLKK